MANVLLILDRSSAAEQLGDLVVQEIGETRIEVIDFSGDLPSFLAGVRRIRGLISDFKPDFVHFQEAVSVPATILAFLPWQLPMTLTVHDPLPHTGEDGMSLSSLKRRFVLDRWRRRCDAAVTHGVALVKALQDLYPRLDGLVFSVPHGPLGGPPVATAPIAGTFLFFGRIHAYKGLGFFVSAVRSLHERGLPVRAVIAGRGEDLQRHRALIDGHPAFELHERYIAPDELPGLFARAQAVVLPYTDGTQSGVAAMALGFGRAIIATRVGALQEMVRDGDNGLLVDPRDAEALAAAMARMIAAPDLAVRMGRRSAELGRTELSWERNAQITLRAYESAVRHKRGRS